MPGRNDLKYEFIANAQPPQGISQRIYKGKISYTKRVLWLIPVTVTITERNNYSNTSLLPYDYYPGGEINTGIDINDINFQNALVKFNLNFSHIPTFSFIPTTSALDIGLNNIALNNADYLARYVGGAPPIAPRNTPFQNFVTAFNNQRRNEQHTGFFPRNGDWLAQKLSQVGNPPPNPPIVNCSSFCENGMIIGDDVLCNVETYTAPFGNGITYTWSVNNTNLVTINPNGNSVQVTRNGALNGQVILTVNISSVECGTIELSTNIQVGTPITGYYYIYSDYHPPIQRPLYSNNSAIFLPANKTFGVTAYITNANPISPSWTRAATSYPFSWSSSGVQLNFSGISGSAAYNQRNGIFNFMANTGCGTATETFTWPVVVQGWGFNINVSPNPANDNLQVIITDETEESKSLSKDEQISMTIYYMNSTTIAKRWNFKNNQNNFNLNVSNLKTGHYILVVEKGNNRQSEQIFIGK